MKIIPIISGPVKVIKVNDPNCIKSFLDLSLILY